jgi:hypothetical protein
MFPYVHGYGDYRNPDTIGSGVVHRCVAVKMWYSRGATDEVVRVISTESPWYSKRAFCVGGRRGGLEPPLRSSRSLTLFDTLLYPVLYLRQHPADTVLSKPYPQWEAPVLLQSEDVLTRVRNHCLERLPVYEFHHNTPLLAEHRDAARVMPEPGECAGVVRTVQVRPASLVGTSSDCIRLPHQ